MKKAYDLTVDANIPDFDKILEQSDAHHAGRVMWKTLVEWIHENQPVIVFGKD